VEETRVPGENPDRQRFQDIGFEFDLEVDMTKEATFRWFEEGN
jgi:hypothetical protein